MSRLAIQVDFPDTPISNRSLLYHFQAINTQGPPMTVRCTVCGTYGKVNTKLHRKGEKVVCRLCR